MFSEYVFTELKYKTYATVQDAKRNICSFISVHQRATLLEVCVLVLCDICVR